MANIMEEWNDVEVQDKLVFQSPIPLNEEQIQILSAIIEDKEKMFGERTAASNLLRAIQMQYQL